MLFRIVVRGQGLGHEPIYREGFERPSRPLREVFEGNRFLTAQFPGGKPLTEHPVDPSRPSISTLLESSSVSSDTRYVGSDRAMQLLYRMESTVRLTAYKR